MIFEEVFYSETDQRLSTQVFLNNQLDYNTCMYSYVKFNDD